MSKQEEMPHECRNILGALAQRRQADRHDIESIKQILPEQSLPDRLSKVSVGGRNDPHIRADRRTAADGRVFALLQHTKQSRLRIGWHVADLIEEQGA